MSNQAPASSKSSFFSVGDILKVHLDKVSDNKLTPTFAVQKVWNKIAGPTVSRQTRVLYVKNDCLFIGVTSATWHNELSFMKQALLASLCQTIPDQVITDIKFKLCTSI